MTFNMIYFEKITELQYSIRLKINDKKIGYIELLGNKHYIVELDYNDFSIPIIYKKCKGTIIELVYRKTLKRAIREARRLTEYSKYTIHE